MFQRRRFINMHLLGNQNQIIYLLVLNICCVAYFIFYLQEISNSLNIENTGVAYNTTPNSDKLVELEIIGGTFYNQNETDKKTNTDIVLIWTPYYNLHPMKILRLGINSFYQVSDCPKPQCFFTSNRSALEEASAVVFHATNLNSSDMPTVRFPHQRWVFMNEEPPFKTKANLKEFNDVFNWTMTYRQDSDIPLPYGEVVSLDVYNSKYNYVDDAYQFHTTKVLDEALRKKQKLVAWIVSNCEAESNRQQLVKQLQQFIPVDIYGACGPHKCTLDDSGDCYARISLEYKFYLSFENALCVDYVTEKFFIPLMYYIVPVVYGIANYSAIAPANSFINANDFSSVKELTEYLIYLNQNPLEYAKFFEWKYKYRIIPQGFGWCELCAKLNNRNLNLPAKVYSNIFEWWWKVEPLKAKSIDSRNKGKASLRLLRTLKRVQLSGSDLFNSSCFTPPNTFPI